MTTELTPEQAYADARRFVWLAMQHQEPDGQTPEEYLAELRATIDVAMAGENFDPDADAQEVKP